MRKLSLRPYSTPGGSGLSGISSPRKVSSAFSGIALSSSREASLLDEGQLEGRIKVTSTIKNSELCLSVSFRSDGRFYAVALANGLINVYNSKTDNILYALNTDDKDLPFNDVSATCVRFKPFQLFQPEESATPSLLSSLHRGSIDLRRKSGTGSDSEHFLPPISSSRSSLQQQYPLRRRRSSVSALGLRSIADELGLFPADDKLLPNNIVTASCTARVQVRYYSCFISVTNGSIKTFNFVTEQCVNEIKENREVLTMGYSKSGAFLATGGGDGCIHVYDDDTKVLTSSYHPPFQYNSEYLRTYSVSFHPESEHEFVSGGWNQAVQFYDVRVPGLLVAKVHSPKVCGEGISFHNTGKEFCVASWKKGEGIQVFDYSMRSHVRNIPSSYNKTESISASSKAFSSRRSDQHQHTLPSSFLYSTRYFMGNFIAVCGAYPGSVAVVECTTGNVITSIQGLTKSVYGIDTCKNKMALVVGNEVSCTEVFL